MSLCAHPNGLPPGRTMCGLCVGHLASRLELAASLLRDLGVTAQRLDHTAPGGQVGGGSKTTVPLPFRDDAAALRDEMESALLLASTQTPAVWGGDPDGPDLLYRITELNRRAVDVVDLPQETLDLGVCGMDRCAGRLRARRGETSTTCPVCGSYWHIETRMDARVRAAWKSYAPARAISKAFGIPVHSIENWARRGTLTEVQRENGRTLYSVGEVYALAQSRRRQSPS